MECDNIHKRCSEEYSALKEEFERYKLRAQSVLKNKSSKVGFLLENIPHLTLVLLVANLANTK